MNKILIIEDESLVAHHLKLILTAAGYKICGIADSVHEAISAIDEQKPDLVLLDIHLKGNLNGIDLAKILTQRHIAFVYLTANFQGKLLEEAKATLPFGFIVKPFREDDLLTTLDVAFFRLQNNIESLRHGEMELDKKLKEAGMLSGELNDRLLLAAHHLQAYVPFDYLNVILINEQAALLGNTGFLRIGFDEYQTLGTAEFSKLNHVDEKKLRASYADLVPVSKATLFNNGDFISMFKDYAPARIIAQAYDIESALFFPTHYGDSQKIIYGFYNRKVNTYTQQHITLLSRLQSALGSFSSDGVTLTATNSFSSVIASPNRVIKVDSGNFGGIIATSPLMLSVLDLITIVAPLDTSVLILGETGTGKEKVAKSIHSLSARKDKPFVIVNCASLPANLVESELFGHEKGAFTGATERRIGKFELSDNGTIFLDEIGEMSADLQVKLLRVLQEQEIERIGGKGPIKIDVRIIAATNRNLEQEMEEGRFRLDLYYRLYVFPLLIPALRERPEDIATLARHFIGLFAKKYNRPVKGISPEVLIQMTGYSWPGNVRELEHFIERSLLLTNGETITAINLPKRSPKNTGEEPLNDDRIKTINENERDYIIAVLEKCNGRIRGADGAAAVMGLPPTTLHSRMKKLGIKYSGN